MTKYKYQQDPCWKCGSIQVKKIPWWLVNEDGYGKGRPKWACVEHYPYDDNPKIVEEYLEQKGS